MEAEGLIKVVSEERKRAVTEKTYDITGGHENIRDAIVRDNNGPAYCALMGWNLHNLYDQFKRYSEREDLDIKRDATGYMEGVVRISESDLGDFFRDIGAVISKYSRGEGDGKLDHTVGIVVTPPKEMV